MKKCKQCRAPIKYSRPKKYCSAFCRNEAAIINRDTIHYCWCCNEVIPHIKGAKKRSYRKFIDRSHYDRFLRNTENARKRLLNSPSHRVNPEVFSYNQRIVIVYLKKYGSLSSISLVLHSGYKHTLNALEKRNIVFKNGDIWYLTEKGNKVNGKIKKFTPDLLERIRNFPLRK